MEKNQFEHRMEELRKFFKGRLNTTGGKIQSQQDKRSISLAK